MPRRAEGRPFTGAWIETFQDVGGAVAKPERLPLPKLAIDLMQFEGEAVVIMESMFDLSGDTNSFSNRK